MPFPKAIDYHKPNKPEIPNGLGIIYVLTSTIYLFFLHFLDFKGALPLASCVLFGGFMGLVDDWLNLRWRYKAFLPIFASIPLIALREGETVMSTYIFGKIDFGIYYYLVIAPLIVTVITNSVNMLGGLNGLETICPLIIIIGFILISQERILLLVPALVLLLLAFYNYRGKIFVGNVGSFSFGTTLAAYAIIANIEQTLLISTVPYVFNSTIILLNHFLYRRRAQILSDGGKLFSKHRRSLITIITYKRKMTERQVVNIVATLFIISTSLAILAYVILP